MLIHHENKKLNQNKRLNVFSETSKLALFRVVRRKFLIFQFQESQITHEKHE